VCPVTATRRKQNSESQQRYRMSPVGIVLAALRNEDLRQRRALRREQHAWRKRTFTRAVSTREGFLVQAGVPRKQPRQLPSMGEVLQHAEVCRG